MARNTTGHSALATILALAPAVGAAQHIRRASTSSAGKSPIRNRRYKEPGEATQAPTPRPVLAPGGWREPSNERIRQ
jgi:hypothetical protein